MNSVLVYTPENSSRLGYILDLMLTDLLGLDYELVSDKEAFQQSGLPKFSYAPAPVADELFFESARLLFEKEIYPQPIAHVKYRKLFGLYPAGGQSALPFDLFASAFYFVTCYIEYLPAKLDKHSRFRGSQSELIKYDMIEKPLVNYYALELKKMLKERFPDLEFKPHKFEYIPTVDVDMAYSYLHKGIRRNTGGFAKSILSSDFADIFRRFKVLARMQKDPFDTYDFIFKVTGQHGLTPYFFFLLADLSTHDKSIHFENDAFRDLIKDTAAKAEVGIHLSYRAHGDHSREKKEIKRLEQITGQNIIRNRYHYLRFHVPNSYLRLIKEGVTEDFSMGYAPHAGFRAGIATPYYFFNLRRNEVTPLRIFPIAFMDTTYNEYYKTGKRKAMESMRNIMNNVHETGGTVYAIWHNSSFCEQGKWEGWRQVFETITQEAVALMNKPEKC